MGTTATTSSSRDLFRLMTDAQKQALFGNTGRGYGRCARVRQIPPYRNCHAADLVYGAGVAKALGLDLERRWRRRTTDVWQPAGGLPV